MRCGLPKFTGGEPFHLLVSAGLLPPCLDPYLCTFYRTLDAGASWQCLSSPFDLVRAFPLAVDPFTSALYAQSFGLVRSLDNGDTWTSLGLSAASSFVASPLVPGTLWAGQAGAVARSRDGGETWQFFSAGLPAGETLVSLAPDPSDPATLYAMTRQSGVFKSTDAGETWSRAGRWPALVEPRGGQLLVDPENPAIVYAGTNGAGVLRLDQSGD